MPAYNFQRQFVPMILSGEKTQTIRRRRKRPTKAGDALKMFVGMRTKSCYQFAEAPCVQTTPCRIFPHKGQMLICVLKGDPKKKYDDNLYAYAVGVQLEGIAKRDGFQTPTEMFDFFKRYGKEELNDFEIINWNPNEMTRRALLLAPDEGKSSVGKNLEDTYSHRLIEVLTEKGATHNEL